MSKQVVSPKISPEDPEWEKWLKICDYTGWEPHGLLEPMKYHGRIIPVNKELLLTPLFFNELMLRVNKVKPVRVAIVGEAGISKTYTAITIAQIVDPKLTIEQVVITGKGYMNLVRTLKTRRSIVLEEPTFHLAARTWFKEWQQIIVQTIESTRFQNNPLFIPVVNRNLLDKTIREYYLNYVIQMFDRGIGRVYRTKHSQWEDKFIRKTAFNIYIYSPGIDLAECGRDTCLECPNLPTCNKNIWPQYERKRAEAIAFYQKRGEEKLEKIEEKKYTFREMIGITNEEYEDLCDRNGKLSVPKVMLRFEISRTNAQLVVREVLDRRHIPKNERGEDRIS